MERAVGSRLSDGRVDIDPGAFLELRDGDLPVLSEAGSFLESLNRHLPAGGQSSGWDRAEFRRFKDVLHNSCAAERPGIAEVAMAVADLLPERTLIYSDMTQFAYVAKEVVDLKLPGRWHHPYGFGTLGYALPAAIGGKVADPDSPVLAIAGDTDCNTQFRSWLPWRTFSCPSRFWSGTMMAFRKSSIQ